MYICPQQNYKDKMVINCIQNETGYGKSNLLFDVVDPGFA